MATFILGGFWHGAGWTFIFWGFLHGFALSLNRIWQNTGYKLWTWFAWLLTFNFLNISWIFFRAKEWEDALKVLTGMFGLSGIVLPLSLKNKLLFLEQYGVSFGGLTVNIQVNIYLFLWIIIAVFLVLFFRNANELALKYLNKKYSYLFISVLIFYSILKLSGYSEFLYFRF